MANILVNASGVKSFPSCPVRANIGTNERMIMSIANRSGQATSLVESVIILVLSLIERFSFHRSLLYAFSVTTIAASTIVPIAMAIPPSDIILEGMPNSFMSANVIRTHIIKAITVTRDAPKFQRNKSSIIAVIISSAVNMDERVKTASLIRFVLS